METPPGDWALDFRQEFEDAITKNTGPALRRVMTAMMKLPKYREAHATDDHFMSAMFVAGLVGSVEDIGTPVEFGAEEWELTNMCNSQYTLGRWVEATQQCNIVDPSSEYEARPRRWWKAPSRLPRGRCVYLAAGSRSKTH